MLHFSLQKLTLQFDHLKKHLNMIFVLLNWHAKSGFDRHSPVLLYVYAFLQGHNSLRHQHKIPNLYLDIIDLSESISILRFASKRSHLFIWCKLLVQDYWDTFTNTNKIK